MIRTKETLKASGDFGVAIFDNSQLIEQLKFQRNAKSSSVTLTTSRCFLKPMLPTNMDDINFGDEKVPITYHNQIIPSPYNFPAFELCSRLESTSNPGFINVSDDFMEHTKEFFEFESRGLIEIKNSLPSHMYFLTDIKQELRSARFQPNDRFYELYDQYAKTPIITAKS